MNSVIDQKIPGQRQLEEELATRETDRSWVRDLPEVMSEYNSNKKKRAEPKSKTMKDTPTLRCKGRSCKLLKHGTQVRVVHDHPKDIKGKRLYGKFRKSDMRWERTPRKITKITLKAGQPPLYKVSGIGNALYTREQLQVYDKDEIKPKSKKKKEDKEGLLPDKYIVEKIVKRTKKKKNGKTKVYYTVKWKGYPSSQNTEEREQT